MKKTVFTLCLLSLAMLFASCNKYQTYAEQKDRERNAIEQYIADHHIKVISEKTFSEQNHTTNVADNEYVLLVSSGVYLQIIRQGCGEKIKNGEIVNVLCRFTETNLFTDSVQLSNNTLAYSALFDKMIVMNTQGTYSASFVKGHSLMQRAYGMGGNSAVPSGWLVPLPYINIGRPVKKDDEIAKVKIIVPHAQGQAYATQNVYPCLYELTYQRER